METGGSRRRRTLSDETLDSPNLRDFLRLKEDENNTTANNSSLSGLTLRAVLSSKQRPSPQPFHVNRTLLDVIKDDPNYGKESKKSWKALKSKLRLSRTGAAWTSSVITPASDVPIAPTPSRAISRRLSTRFSSDGLGPDPAHTIPELSHLSSGPGNNNRAGPSAMMMRRNSSRVPSMAAGGYGRGFEGSLSSSSQQAMWDGEGSGSSRSLSSSRQAMWDGEIGSNNGNENNNAVLVTEGEGEGGEEEGVGETEGETTEEGGGGGEPRMSLMALLAETDRQMGLDGSTYIMSNDDDEEEEAEEEEVATGGGVEYNNCCVCMVRTKGAAFIPCGHTFCRLCSRELWVQRGNCPLCNGFILEVLDIF